MRYLSLFLILLGLALQCVLGIREKTATFDEPAHLPAGYSYLVTRDFRMNTEHPPLTKAIAGVPLLFLDLRPPSAMKSWQGRDSYAFGEEFLYHSGQDADKILFWGRLPMVLMSLALALVVFLWVRDIAGFRAGLFASFMYSLCPTIIAHSSLVTPDIGVSLFMSAAVYVLWKYVKRPSAFRLALSGIALGLAFLSKFNALVLVPAYCVLLYVSKAGRFRVKCIQTFRSILVMVLIAFFVLWSGYFFEFGPLLRHGGTHNAFELLTQSWPKAVREKALFFGERFSLPLPSYISGLFWHSIVVPTKIGRDSFLLGAAMRRSPWYGDIFAFTVKTPIPFLVFMLIGLYQFIKRRRYQTLDYSFPLVPAAMVLLGDSVSRLSVQLKYILPAYPFLIVFMGTTFEWGAMKNALYRALFIVLCLWYAVCALSIFPHYLAYFNELAGGPQNGYRYLVDSNLDWGQDLKLLKNYIDTKKIQTITLAYFGTADPAYYGISYTKLEPFKAASGWIAVSATLLQGVHAPRGSYEWLKQYKPEAKIGYSIFVYKISS